MSDLDTTGLLAAAALYATIMPSLGDVRRATVGTETAADVRNGIVVGSGLLVGIGAMLAAQQRDLRPLYLLGGVAALTAVAFELTLRQPGSRTETAEPGPRTMGRWGL